MGATNFIKHLKKLMEETGISATDFASDLEISRRALGRKLDGDTKNKTIDVLKNFKI